VQQTVEKAYLSYDEAAHYCGVSRWTLHRAVKSGELEASGSGRLTRFHIDTLEKWMRQRP
jgi:excisionase family DNA binding protein